MLREEVIGESGVLEEERITVKDGVRWRCWSSGSVAGKTSEVTIESHEKVEDGARARRGGVCVVCVMRRSTIAAHTQTPCGVGCCCTTGCVPCVLCPLCVVWTSLDCSYGREKRRGASAVRTSIRIMSRLQDEKHSNESKKKTK